MPFLSKTPFFCIVCTSFMPYFSKLGNLWSIVVITEVSYIEMGVLVALYKYIPKAIKQLPCCSLDCPHCFIFGIGMWGGGVWGEAQHLQLCNGPSSSIPSIVACATIRSSVQSICKTFRVSRSGNQCDEPGLWGNISIHLPGMKNWMFQEQYRAIRP